MSIQTTLEYIHKTSWLGSKPGLSRTYELLEKLDNPHKKLKFVHVAGTNGKGSTCAYIASVLTKAGYKTGLYTSPYINFFNERIRINGECISDSDLEKFVDIIRPFADSMEDAPTEFEVITALAMKYFYENECDIVVLEVGMGGELDSTNVIDTPECAVITPISLDHTAVLGNTLREVALAKSGIIKGGSVVCADTQGDAYDVIKSVCKSKNAELICPDLSQMKNACLDITGNTFDYKSYTGLKTGLTGTYQPQNAVVALTALLVLRDKGYKITDDDIYEGLAETKWQGRFEVLGKDPVFILDGAHNPHGMNAALDSLKELFPDKKIVFVVGAMADKDVKGMFSVISPIADIFYTVTPDNNRSMDADELAHLLGTLGAKAVSRGKGFDAAVSSALKRAGKDGVVAALGSLYFSNDIRKAYESAVK